MHTLGVVSYRNALPLWKPLENLSGVRVVRDLPARLQQRIDTREVDAALLPIVDFLRHGGHRISDAGITADGDVRSVLIFARRAPDKWRTLGLDTSSHTSVALSQVLLRDHWNIRPRLEDAAPDFDAMAARFDAWLLIGDPALEARQKCLHDSEIQIFDLAHEWQVLTGLPFVFAAWVTHADLSRCEREELGDLLSLSRNKGLQQIPTLARESATQVLEAAVIESYLRHAIGYTISERHRAAIEEFGARCRRAGLL